MRHWNGVIMFAPQPPAAYAIPNAERCIFRVMHEHGDTHAWNLYWLSRPDTDRLLGQPADWFRHYVSLSTEQTHAFYEALDTVVWHRLTLSAVVSQPPRQARRILQQANLAQTSLYALHGGEDWRRTMLGRLFLAERLATEHRTQAGNKLATVVALGLIKRRSA